jgi:hypothetical protein
MEFSLADPSEMMDRDFTALLTEGNYSTSFKLPPMA